MKFGFIKKNNSGSYEFRVGERAVKIIFLENGTFERITNGGRVNDAKWKIDGKEVLLGGEAQDFEKLFKIELNGDLTMIECDSFYNNFNKKTKTTFKKLK